LPALPLALGGSPYVFTFHAPVWRELLDERQGSYSLPPAVQGAAVGSLRRAEGLVAKRAGATVVLSEFMRGELKLLDAGAAERATVVPGGIDTTRFFPARDAPDGRPEPGSPPMLFTARRLIPRTGVDELIRAMPIVLGAWPGAKLMIAGTGALEPELRALAQRLGVAERVELLGRISDDELVRSYRRATLVVMPTRELEGFGLTTAEALACGAVVVGTPAGATPELLAPIDPGLVTHDQSAASIAAAVVELLGQPDRLHQLRARVVDRVVPAMGWDRVADRYLALYERLIG
jgi:glycosyltransferase involved in cell wall biosynthesis